MILLTSKTKLRIVVCMITFIICIRSFNAQTGTCLNFDGVNDNIRLPLVNYSASNKITIEAWVRAINISTNVYYEIARQEYVSNPDWLVSFQNNGTILSFGLKTTTGYSELDVPISASTYTNGVWRHVAATYDGTIKCLYVDGVLVGTEAKTGNITFLGTSHYIGSRNNFDEYFRGEIDEVRYWTVARTQCEINTYKNIEIPTTAPGLIGNYHFNQGIAAANNTTVTTLIDAAGSIGTGTLVGFGLATGTLSNWVAASASVSTIMGPSAICTGGPFIYSITPIPGATSYVWSLPVGWTGSSTTNTIMVNVGASGNLSVTITNTCTTTLPIVKSVTITTTPTVNSTVSNTLLCSGQSATLTATGASSYTWNPGSLIGSSIVVSPSSSVNYTVLGSNGPGCDNTSAVSISVNPSPTVSTVFSNTLLCSGQSATLTASGASNYTWNPGALTGSIIIVTPIISTNYTVLGENAQNCNHTSLKTISVNPTPTVNANSSSTLLCSGQSVTLTASGASTYTWNPGALVGSNIVVTPMLSTNYTVVGTNVQNCSNTSIKSMSVNPTSTINISSSGTLLCAGQSATLTANGAATYSWNPGPLTGSIIIVSPTNSLTNYTVIGYGVSNCSNTSITSVSVNPSPTISASSTDSLICQGQVAALTAYGGISYTWTPGASTATTILISPLSSTNYTVVGSNSFGCTNSFTILQNVTICDGIFENSVFGEHIKIYPNPSNGIFNVAGLKKDLRLDVVDLLGKGIISTRSVSEITEFNLSDLSAGLYYLYIWNGTDKTVMKIIKE